MSAVLRTGRRSAAEATLYALLDLGCDAVALAHRARAAFARIGAADDHHDRALVAARHTLGMAAQVAAVQGCGCDGAMARASGLVATAQAADVVEDRWIGALAIAVERLVAALCALNAGIERAAKALRGGAR